MIAESRRKTVLLVEEDPELRQFLADLLFGQGYYVLQAGNTKEALETASRREPDVILLSVCSPPPQRLSVVDALKQNGRTGQIPVVVVGATGDGLPDHEKSRTTAFSQKPFRLATILSHLERVAAK
jgi:CheY-like chemotaxis protein